MRHPKVRPEFNQELHDASVASKDADWPVLNLRSDAWMEVLDGVWHDKVSKYENLLQPRSSQIGCCGTWSRSLHNTDYADLYSRCKHDQKGLRSRILLEEPVTQTGILEHDTAIGSLRICHDMRVSIWSPGNCDQDFHALRYGLAQPPGSSAGGPLTSVPTTQPAYQDPRL